MASNTLSLLYLKLTGYCQGFPGGSEGKASACNAGDLGLNPGSGRFPWKEMATHSSTLAWKIPWMEKPGRLPNSRGALARHDLRKPVHSREDSDHHKLKK